MNKYRADLHIHTVLSPCGDLEMSPANIVAEAELKGLDIIGITDHNTTLQCGLVAKLAAERGIFVLQGAEITTKEEVHCLAFFENSDALSIFQEFLDRSLAWIPNAPEIFGHQLQVNEYDEVVYEEQRLLINALSCTLKDAETLVHQLNGLFIPAHVDKKKNSIFSQLGLLPENLMADALELTSKSATGVFISPGNEGVPYTVICSSDAHFPSDIGAATTCFRLGEPTFSEIAMALRNEKGRRVIPA